MFQCRKSILFQTALKRSKATDIKAEFHALMDKRDSHGLLLHALSINPKVDTSLISSLLSRHTNDECKVALKTQIFGVLRLRNIPVGTEVLHAMIHLFAKKHDSRNAELYFARMRELGIPPSLATIDLMMQSYANDQPIEKLENVRVYFDMIKQLQYTPTTASFEAIMDAYSSVGDLDNVNRIYKDIENSREPCTLKIFSLLINATTDWLKFDSILQTMKTLYISPDLYIYSTILRTLIKADNFIKALEFYTMLLEDSQVGTIDQNVFIMMMEFYSSKGLVDETRLCFNEMVKRGFDPTLESYNVMLKVALISGNLSYAEIIYSAMTASKILPDANILLLLAQSAHCAADLAKVDFYMGKLLRNVQFTDLKTLTSIIAFYTSTKNVKSAISLYHRIKDENHTHTLETLNMMIKMFQKLDDTHNIKLFCKELFQSGFKFNIDTFNTILKSKKERHDVIDYFKTITASHVNPNLDTFHILLDYFAKAKDTEAVSTFFHSMSNYGVWPDQRIFATLAKSCSSSYTFERMMEHDIKPGIMIYNSLLESLLSRKQYRAAKTCFEELFKKGPVPDAKTFEITIVGLSSNYDSSTDIIKYLKQMLDLKIAPSMDTLVALMGSIRRPSHFTFIEPWYNAIVLDSVDANVNAYNILLEALFRIRNAEKASHYFQKMTRRNCLPNTLTFNTMMSGTLKLDKMDFRTFHHYYRALLNRSGLLPNTSTYNLRIDVYTTQKRSVMVKKMYVELAKHNLKPDEQTFLKIFQCLRNECKWIDIDEIWASMPESLYARASPEIWSILNLAFVQIGNFDKLVKVSEYCSESRIDELAIYKSAATALLHKVVGNIVRGILMALEFTLGRFYTRQLAILIKALRSRKLSTIKLLDCIEKLKNHKGRIRNL